MKIPTWIVLFAFCAVLAPADDAKIASPNSQCDYWKINWRDSSGKVWGIATSSTRAGVIKERDNSIRFEQDYAKFFHTEFDTKFSNPSTLPRSVLLPHTNPAPSQRGMSWATPYGSTTRH